MNRRKGFTLIELLAVITIIGIVSLIIIPSVSRLIKNASNQVFESNEKLLAISAENYYKMNTDLLPYAVSDMKAVNLNILIQEGYTKNFKDPKNAEIVCSGYVVVKKTALKKYEYYPYLSCGEGMITEGYNDYLYLLP